MGFKNISMSMQKHCVRSNWFLAVVGYVIGTEMLYVTCTASYTVQVISIRGSYAKLSHTLKSGQRNFPSCFPPPSKVRNLFNQSFTIVSFKIVSKELCQIVVALGLN